MGVGGGDCRDGSDREGHDGPEDSVKALRQLSAFSFFFLFFFSLPLLYSEAGGWGGVREEGFIVKRIDIYLHTGTL